MLANGQYSVEGGSASFLTDDGTQSGAREWNANYAGAPVEAFWDVPVGRIARVNVIQFSIGGSGNFSQGGYGSRTVLTNGVDVRFTTNGVDVDLTTNNIVSNQDLLDFGAGNSQITNFQGINDSFEAGLNILGTGGEGIILNGNLGDRVRVVLNDDFSSFNTHRFLVRFVI